MAGRAWGLLFVLLCWQAAEAEQALEWRREYNQVAARIDTLARLYGGSHLEHLQQQRPLEDLIPDDMQLVLLFWADDEAEIYLNGHRISDTRLTTTQVEIPSLYVRQQNSLQVNCWDTEGVESGFMAGLYLRDGGGRLRQVLVSGREGWWAGEEPAQEIYYTHDQPDIPGAQVIWADQLFGEVRLEGRFDAADLRRARGSRSFNATDLALQSKNMESHLVVANLIKLQKRRAELTQLLEKGRAAYDPAKRYKGYVRSKLAFTLGHAAPFAEEEGILLAENLDAWAQTLPAVHQDLVFGERRELKGREAATRAREMPAAEAAFEARRRRDYQAPPERGPGEQGGQGGAVSSTNAVPYAPSVSKGMQWGVALTIVALVLYLAGSCRVWWKLFNGKVWQQ